MPVPSADLIGDGQLFDYVLLANSQLHRPQHDLFTRQQLRKAFPPSILGLDHSRRTRKPLFEAAGIGQRNAFFLVDVPVERPVVGQEGAFKSKADQSTAPRSTLDSARRLKRVVTAFREKKKKV